MAWCCIQWGSCTRNLFSSTYYFATDLSLFSMFLYLLGWCCGTVTKIKTSWCKVYSHQNELNLCHFFAQPRLIFSNGSQMAVKDRAKQTTAGYLTGPVYPNETWDFHSLNICHFSMFESISENDHLVVTNYIRRQFKWGLGGEKTVFRCWSSHGTDFQISSRVFYVVLITLILWCVKVVKYCVQSVDHEVNLEETLAPWRSDIGKVRQSVSEFPRAGTSRRN